MERVKDSAVIRLIERISEHYQANICNRYLRPALLQLQIDKSVWDQIELLTEKMEMFRYQGFHLDELYRQISACARFVDIARNNMPGILRLRMNSAPSGPDKIIREMAASNFMSNLKVFADQLNELYINLVELDKADAQKRKAKPVYEQITELYSIGRLIVGH